VNIKAKHVKELQVSMAGLAVGTLAQTERGQIWFEYNPAWIQSGFALTPTPGFALKSGAFKATNNTFYGLHGVFNDALPDGWGLLLMDRALKNKLGWDVHEITPLDRLAYIGNRAMGALEFKPTIENDEHTGALSLAGLAEDALLVQEGSADEVLRALTIHGGSPGGARPKVTLALGSDGGDVVMSGFEKIPANFDHWMVKFRSKNTDPACMGRIELAYAKMATLAKIDMPPSRLISANVRGIEEAFFAVKRFDRDKNKKLHVISLGGMLDASHHEPCLDYTQLLKAVHFATRNVKQVERAFRLMAFNVLAHNKDDHVKNFAFIYDGQDWKFSPAFDLTFSGGMNNQHTTAIAGQGNPNLAAIELVAKSAGIKNWKLVVDEVFLAVSQWEQIADTHKVEPRISNAYSKAIQSGPCYADLA
jgi:serine/threonine-protein kinase HipA